MTTLFEQLALFTLPPAPPPPKQRHLHIGARIVAYTLATGRRRLSMTVDERGLRVGAPTRTSVAEIEAFVAGHGPWVLAKLDEYAARTACRHLSIRDGQRLPLLGGEVVVSVMPGANRAHWEEGRLVLKARPDAPLDLLARRAVQRRAREHFADRVAHYAARLGRTTLPPVGLSSARTRWGSCSERSGIRLNWRLIHLPHPLVDYVVAHELAHLTEMNHGPRFWAVVESVYPDWKSARAELKRRGPEIPIL